MNIVYHSPRVTIRWWGTLTLLLLFDRTAGAANVTVGSHVLLPNTANQIITISVTGGEQIAGEDFFAQIGDGGSYIGGTNTRPSFTNVDIIHGTVFSANNDGPFGDPNGTPAGSNAAHPLLWVDGTVTFTGTVAAAGSLATLTLDTTGLNSGTFALKLTGVASALGGFNTKLLNANGQPIPLTVTNGSLIVAVPTPGDFNYDGFVDAADYVEWRKGLGTVFGPTDYNVWRSHFGQSIGGGSGFATAQIPEPNDSILLIVAILGLAVLGTRPLTRCSRLTYRPRYECVRLPRNRRFSGDPRAVDAGRCVSGNVCRRDRARLEYFPG